MEERWKLTRKNCSTCYVCGFEIQMLYIVLVYAPKADNDNKHIRKENDL